MATAAEKKAAADLAAQEQEAAAQAAQEAAAEADRVAAEKFAEAKTAEDAAVAAEAAAEAPQTDDVTAADAAVVDPTLVAQSSEPAPVDAAPAGDPAAIVAAPPEQVAPVQTAPVVEAPVAEASAPVEASPSAPVVEAPAPAPAPDAVVLTEPDGTPVVVSETELADANEAKGAPPVAVSPLEAPEPHNPVTQVSDPNVPEGMNAVIEAAGNRVDEAYLAADDGLPIDPDTLFDGPDAAGMFTSRVRIVEHSTVPPYGHPVTTLVIGAGSPVNAPAAFALVRRLKAEQAGSKIEDVLAAE
jgi:hypothetical protein